MKAIEYIKSKTNVKPVDLIIKGQAFYRVENGYIPKAGYESISIFDYMKQVNNVLEKGKKAEIAK